MRPVFLLVPLLASPAGAHVPIRIGGVPVRWAQPGHVSVVVAAAGPDELAPDEHLAPLRLAIDAWNDVDGTSAHLWEDAAPASRARTDVQATDLHLVMFDAANATGWFVDPSFVAVTPILVDGAGRILDADVIFNARDWSFATDGSPARFDVQAVATHELGHLLGLDHTPWIEASLYPFVSSGDVAARSLSADERNGLRALYPAPGGGHGAVAGSVRRTVGSAGVAGAWVQVWDAAGRSAGGGLCAADGSFRIDGLPPGRYALAALPLDGPVTQVHLSATGVQVDFAAALGGAIDVAAGQTASYGELRVGPDALLDVDQVFAPNLRPGDSAQVTFLGAELFPGSTLAVSDPSFSVSHESWFGGSASARVAAPAHAAPGHVDLLLVGAGGQVELALGALEVVAPQPSVASVAPAVGDPAGGTPLAIAGASFRAGARVAIGEQVYADGAGATVLGDGAIALVTRPTTAGLHDVVVLDPTGVEGRLPGAFRAMSQPALSSVFPPAGSAAGGTELVLRGTGFDPGLVVRIDGQVQPATAREDASTVRVVTSGGAPGGPYAIEVENPGGARAGAVFAYAPRPDPLVVAVDPAQGSSAGGDEVVVRGAGFGAGSPAVEVWFGADPWTGAGGERATRVRAVGPGELLVTTPAHVAASVRVLVRDPASGQAVLAPQGFTFVGRRRGGGCATTVAAAPAGPGDALHESVWVLLVLAGLALRAAAARPRAAS